MSCCKRVSEDDVVIQNPSEALADSDKYRASHPSKSNSHDMCIEDFPDFELKATPSTSKDEPLKSSFFSRNGIGEKKSSQVSFLTGSMVSSSTNNPLNNSFKSLAGLVLTDSEENDDLADVLDMLKEDESYRTIANFCEESKDELNKAWGISAIKPFKLSSQEPLTVCTLDNLSDGVIVMEGWNKVLAFRNMFAEALIARWRIGCAIENLIDYDKTLSLRSSLGSKIRARKSVLVPTTLKRMYSTSSSGSDLEGRQVNSRAHRNVESNLDPVALEFGERTPDLKVIIIVMLDMAVRELCPHAQIVQREAYRSSMGSMDPDPNVAQVFSTKCSDFQKICALLASYGLEPRYWVVFCEAFLWAMKTHSPYIQPHESDELEKLKGDGAFGKFIAGMVVLPLLEATLRYNASLRSTYIVELKNVFRSHNRMADLLDLGSSLFENVLRNFPEMSDYFVQSDVDEISVHLMETFCAVILDSEKLSEPMSSVREKLIAHGKIWQQLEIPKDCFSLIGVELIDLVSPIFTESFPPSEAERIEIALAFIFKESQKFIIQPLLNQENTFNEAKRFYEDVAKELNWSSQVFEDRLFEVNREIIMTGTYTQTSKEIEIGARLCWRNSAKCIGRIAWNTLQVRDMRHCTNPNDMIKCIIEHLKLATGGTNIQSVMTVFRPQLRNEIWGLRFWSSQFVRYAGYTDEKTGRILGDPANAKFTSFLIESDLWSPPHTKSAFDILPIVIKLPNNDVPFVIDLPKTYCHEVMIEHPKYPKVKDLNLKWAAVPAISNFVMRIGGIDYPCCPFNGWFLSTEIRRNLLERYDVVIPLANAMELDLDDKMLTDIVGSNLETAILYSFEKNGFTIVDPMTVGKSFLTHCARERTAGRECPAQWSWIGGLVGPNNPTWHLEMRDFMKNPQYDYCCNPWEVVKSDASIQINKKFDDDDGDGRKEDDSVIIPNVIIAFGSETGTAEAAASSLARKLRFCKTTVLSLNELVSSDLLQKCTEGTKYLFVICSTFGRGMLPNNAKSFLEIELAKDVCSQFKYAVLALGSSLYPDFCKAGKDVDEKLNASGAGELIKIEMADASQNGDVTISKWITQVEKTVLPSTLVQQLMSLSSKTEDSLDDVCYRMKWQVGSFRKSALKEESGLMLCKQNLELFIDGNINSRSTRHIELELPDGVTYESGDHLMVKPLNDINTVKRLCKCFTYELTNAAVLSGYNKLDNNLESKTSPIEFQMNVPFSILSFPSEKERKDGQTEGTLFRSPNLMDRPLIEVLARFSDLSFVHISYVVDLLTMLLQKSKAIARDDKMASNFVQIAESILNAYIKGKTKSIENFVAKFPTIVELLEKFNSLFCVPRGNDEDPLLSIADILVLMPGLQPRYYSISSASEVTPRSITLTVGVVNEKTALGRNVKGVCSHYLAGLCPGDTIQATIVTSSFRLPMKRHHPLVFIGAGTGLAPIMGFLRERSHQFDKYRSSSFGECHLFFGCRDEDEFLYRDQLLEWEKRGILKLHIAFSRSKFCNKQYVQDSLTNYGSDLVDLLLSKDETFVYICGAAHIANECSDKCIELIGKHANMSRINAMHFMMKLRVEGRWELDVWGDVKSLHSVQEERTKNLFTSSLKAATLHKSDIDNVISGK